MGEITLEQVDKIRERTNVTYEAAKAALEATGGDMLEAMILLERQGKAPPAGEPDRVTGGFYSTRAGGGQIPEFPPEADARHGEGMAWYEVLQTLWRLLRNCTVNQFEIWRKGQMMTAMPVLVLLLLLIFAMWASGPLLLAGLLIGCRYRFSGPDLGGDPVNAVIEKMHDAVDEAVVKVKDELKGKKR